MENVLKKALKWKNLKIISRDEYNKMAAATRRPLQREKELLEALERERTKVYYYRGIADEMKKDLDWMQSHIIPIDEAMDRQFPIKGIRDFPVDSSKKAQLISLAVLGLDGQPTTLVGIDQPIIIEAHIVVRETIEEMNVSFMLHDAWVKYVSATHSAMLPELPVSWQPGKYSVRMEFPPGIINRGLYGIRSGLGWMDGTVYDYQAEGLRFEIVVAGEIAPHSIHSHGLLMIIPKYSIDVAA